MIVAESVGELSGAAKPAALVGVVAEALGLERGRVEVRSASPRGGGLGASSAVAVGLIAAIDRRLGRPDATAADTVHLARDLEAQHDAAADRHAGSLSGTARRRAGHPLSPGGEQVEHLAIDLEALAERLLIVYSGSSHFSAATNWEIIRGCLEGDPEVRGLFHGIAAVAAERRGRRCVGASGRGGRAGRSRVEPAPPSRRRRQCAGRRQSSRPRPLARGVGRQGVRRGRRRLRGDPRSARATGGDRALVGARGRRGAAARPTAAALVVEELAD